MAIMPRATIVAKRSVVTAGKSFAAPIIHHPNVSIHVPRPVHNPVVTIRFAVNHALLAVSRPLFAQRLPSIIGVRHPVIRRHPRAVIVGRLFTRGDPILAVRLARLRPRRSSSVILRVDGLLPLERPPGNVVLPLDVLTLHSLDGLRSHVLPRFHLARTLNVSVPAASLRRNRRAPSFVPILFLGIRSGGES
jgi:hypothetical protein